MKSPASSLVDRAVQAPAAAEPVIVTTAPVIGAKPYPSHTMPMRFPFASPARVVDGGSWSANTSTPWMAAGPFGPPIRTASTGRSAIVQRMTGGSRFPPASKLLTVAHARVAPSRTETVNVSSCGHFWRTTISRTFTGASQKSSSRQGSAAPAGSSQKRSCAPATGPRVSFSRREEDASQRAFSARSSRTADGAMSAPRSDLSAAGTLLSSRQLTGVAAPGYHGADEPMDISLLMDVEDLVDPAADDVTCTVAEIVAGEGARATFCVAGERVRQWNERGRTDVIRALSRHDVGFHTTGHSIHPTVLEYLAGRGWEDGVAEVLRRERQGFDALRDAFGTAPSCWGGPGNTWGPQVNEAMARLGVPAVVYAQTRVPRGEVHRFCGALSYPSGCSMQDGEYHLDAAWEANLARMLGEIERRRGDGAQWMEAFLGHPSRILHEAFWDGPSFAGGRVTPREQWTSPRRKSDADLAAALENLAATVRSLAAMPGIRIRTIREMNERFASALEEPLAPQELREIAPVIDGNIVAMGRWPILPDGLDLSTVRDLTRERLDTLRRLRLP